MRRILFSIAMFTLLALSGAQAEAQCVRVALIDDGGQVIKPDGLVTGVLVGDDPVFVSAVPEHRDRRVVGAVACPPEVMAPVIDLYNLSCRNEQAMRQAAVNNATNIDVVRKRCQDLGRAVATGR